MHTPTVLTDRGEFVEYPSERVNAEYSFDGRGPGIIAFDERDDIEGE